MYKTSEAWRINQAEPLTSEAFLEVSYSISDPDLPEAEATDNGALELLSNISQTVDVFDREIIPYATLEQDLWLLDGTKITVPEEVPKEDRGYISEWICDGNGDFNPYPAVEIFFDSKVSLLPGLTITWGSAHGDYPTVFSVKTYDEAGAQLHNEQITDNSDVISIVAFEMRNFVKIRIEIHKWLCGNRRARIAKVFEGIKKVYNKSDLLKFSSLQEVDPLSAKLPKYEVSFEINNTSGDYNPNNEHGLSKYMMERQEVRTRYGFRMGNGSVEWIPGGLYFLSDWEAPQNGLSASFKARDLMGFLDGTYYKGNYSPGGTSLYALAEDVLTEANLPLLRNQAPRWVVDAALGNIATQSPLPVRSFAECLQLIANAARAIIYFDRAGTLHIEQLALFAQDNVRFEIDDDNSYSKAEIGLLKPLKRICVSTYTWQVDAEKTIYDSILKLEMGKNVFIVEYSDAAKAVKVTGISSEYSDGNGLPDSNKVIVDCYSKCCRFEIHRGENDSAACHIALSGETLKSTETIVSVEHSDIGEIIPLKNVLITDIEQARELGGWLRDRYNNRKNLSVQWRADPSIDATDFVRVSNGSLSQKARVLSTSFDFSGAFKGKNEGMVIE